MVLYRKYRPQTFEEIVGQDHIKTTILASLAKGNLSHAYLFTGPRGTGKTSTARIFAKAVNCSRVKDKFGEPCNTCENCLAVAEGSHLDLLEIDAASNRGIDEIRELREKIKLSPSTGRYKVYIVDEAHMLTHDAFNALLKTLEEPPPHAIFILATTEPQKLPATIVSRTNKFDFRPPTIAQIVEKLEKIKKSEGWKIGGEVLKEIATQAAGAYRDAEVLLEKVASTDPEASIERAQQILGRIETKSILNILFLIQSGKTKDALNWLNNYLDEGGSVRVLAEGVLDSLRQILLIKAGAEEIVEASDFSLDELKKLSSSITRQGVLKLVHLFNTAIENLRDSTIPQLPIEIAIIEATLDTDSEPKAVKTVKTVKNLEEIKEPTQVKEESAPSQSKSENKKSPNPRDNKNEEKILQLLQKNWDKILKETKSGNNSLAYFLKEAKPVELDEDLLIIEFRFPFHKQKAEERKYREVIETALEKITGTPLRFKGKISSNQPRVVKKSAPKREQPSPANEEVDPVEMFGKLE